MRGRPPTPPLSTLAPGESPGMPSETHLLPQPYEADFARRDAGPSSRNSPEPHSTDIQGQYVDPTSGLSFLERARDRFSSRRTPSEHIQDDDWSYRQQPVLQAGDKPLVLPDVLSAMETALPTGDNAIESSPAECNSRATFDTQFRIRQAVDVVRCLCCSDIS